MIPKELWMFNAIMLFLAMIPCFGYGDYLRGVVLMAMFLIHVGIIQHMIEQDNERYG